MCQRTYLSIRSDFLDAAWSSPHLVAMGRPNPATDDGLIYHAMNRGNNRADVFDDDGDREAFLESLRVAMTRYPFAPFGCCLMSNHFP